ncbi:MAG: competence/damage-inducible protein A [bacterium]|nr:MAG: competence/damage-inducible protein A [bacterium]
MIAEIISIGNELLNGNTVNSNATFIAKSLHENGVSVNFSQTVRDDAFAIKSALQLALQRAEIVLITGGLGPTHDDITKVAVSEYFDRKLIFREDIYQKMRKMFERRGIPMPEINRSQAYVPENAEVMNNPVGTAPGLIFRRGGRYAFVMPGVPREMTAMLKDSVIPLLRKECPDCRVAVNIFRTTGIAESAIYEKIEKELKSFSSYEIAFLPRFTGVDLRVIRTASDMDDQEKFDRFRSVLSRHIAVYIYSEDETELEEVLGRLLSERQETVAVAESLTGGLIQDKITNISGSSAYYMGGVVAYSNEAKERLLMVKENTLENHGAVSKEVAAEMAQGIQKQFQTDLGISTTGIAGPTGATATKPIGLVYIGVAYHSKVKTRRFQFGTDREINKQRAAQAALELARQVILEINS